MERKPLSCAAKRENLAAHAPEAAGMLSTITHAIVGNIDWRFAILLAVGVIPGARIGSKLAVSMSDRHLGRTVAIFLGIVSVLYAAEELFALVG